MSDMPRFFINPVDGDVAVITGADAHHLSRVLRVRVGEALTLCDGRGTDYFGEVSAVSPDAVEVTVCERRPTMAEPSTAVTLYQGLPKSEKMDFIVQKAVELGAVRVVPVSTARSIVRLKGDEAVKKQTRWQKIAAEAAGQSGRGIIPKVGEVLSFAKAVEQLKNERAVVCYEGGGVPLSQTVNTQTESISVFIGPEGGFDVSEIEQLKEAGVTPVTLGNRILRCETAPIVALSVVMQLSGNLE